VLPALDKRDKIFYSKLSDEEKKGYSSLILMRAMSFLTDQNPDIAFQILMVNDIVNIGFWQLSKHPELQHQLLCCAGLGIKQYHPWVSTKSKQSKTPVIDSLLIELYPGINHVELKILRDKYDGESIKTLAQDAGKSDAEIKKLLDDAKNLK
jgi:hypothetical protein